MFSQVQQALECLTAALNVVETAPTGELRRTLGLAKQLRARVELLETKAASAVARRECHGDGGAGLLNEVGGRSRADAARNVRTETELAELPAARTAVSEGEISLANAAKLAQAARKTSPDAVQGDADLVQMAKTLPEDEFAQAAQRWTIRHQSADDLAAQHRRNRRNRNVRFWNGDDGSVQMRGSFDAEMGARIQQRLHQQAEQLRQTDRRRQTQSQSSAAAPAGRDSGIVPNKAVRTRDQRMADALDTLLASDTSATPPARTPTQPSKSVSATEPAQAPSAGGAPPSPRRPSAEARTQIDPPDALDRNAPVTNDTGRPDAAQRAEPEPAFEPRPTPPVGSKAAEIIVRADLSAFVGEAGGIAEICGVGPIPPSTLRRMACNSDVWVEIFGDELTPLYETVASRAPTAAQRRALIARDGACVGCGEPPGECEAHHITPCQRGGKTRLDNLVLVCWRCHDLIHDHNWQVTVRDGRYRLAPPDPAHPAQPAPQRKPTRYTPRTPTTTRPSPAAKPLWEDPAA